MTRFLCALLMLAIVGLGVQVIRALPVDGPSAGVCYASDGVNVETTWIGGSGDYAYPTPSSGTIERHEDGSFTVIHRTLFVPIERRVWLPAVSK